MKPPVESTRGDAAFRHWVPRPVRFGRVLVAVLVAFLSALVGGLLLPWQQSVTGAGRVIAFAPVERRQSIDAPFDGRLLEWHVQEGSHVESGDLLAELVDLDPDLLSRLEQEQDVLRERLESYRVRLRTLRERTSSIEKSQKNAVVANDARVTVAKERRIAAAQAIAAAEAELATSRANTTRHRSMVAQGLVSQRDVEVVVAAEARAQANLDVARAQLSAAVAEVASAQASLDQARAHAQGEVDAAHAATQSAETDVQAAQASLLKVETRLARQRNQHIRAPRAGSVFRILANQGGEQVKAGDPIALLVPDSLDRAAEIYVDGNDAALVQPGRLVRLQFEGWPAVQFVGWPSVAVGTFPGKVAFVDAHDDGYGRFRVVVSPVTAGGWPSPQFLRQGVRANGWIMLDEVRLGYELWRQFNGFPPAVKVPDAEVAKANKGLLSGTSGRGGKGEKAGKGDKEDDDGYQ